MLIKEAVIDGAILSVIICGYISLILKVNPRFEMKSYPREIIDCVEPQTRKEKRGFLLMALPMLILAMLYLVWSMVSDYKDFNVSYFVLLLHSFVILTIWNFFDLVIYDWVIFCRINPDFMVLPGTKGHPAYKDYKYHLMGFLKGIIFSAVGAAIVAGIVFIIRLF